MSTADAKPPVAQHVDGPPPALLILRAPYYTDIVDALRDGAVRVLVESGARFEVLDVAGALELAGAVRLAMRAAETAPGRRYDGFVVLGCVVRGETDHYEHVCREAMAGLTQVTLQFGICLGNGLLTVDRVEQGLARASKNGPNKGAEAAAAALIQIRAARWLGAV